MQHSRIPAYDARICFTSFLCLTFNFHSLSHLRTDAGDGEFVIPPDLVSELGGTLPWIVFTCPSCVNWESRMLLLSHDLLARALFAAKLTRGVCVTERKALPNSGYHGVVRHPALCFARYHLRLLER